MKALNAGLTASLAAASASLCYLIEIAPTTAGVAPLYLTDCDFDLVVNGTTYHSSTGFDISSVQVQSQTAGSSAEFSLFLGIPNSFTTNDIIGGRLDQAIFSVSVVDFTAPGEGSILIYSGKIGQITCDDGLSATMQVGSLLDQYVQVATDSYSPTCRANFGDSECTVALAQYIKQATVTYCADGQQMQTNLSDDSDYWDAGLFYFTSGLNNGVAIEVGAYLKTNGAVVLKLPAPYPIAAGDTGTIYPGCDKTPTTCLNRWNNIDNFRGEDVTVPPVTTATTLNGSLPTPPNDAVAVTKGQLKPPQAFGGFVLEGPNGPENIGP